MSEWRVARVPSRGFSADWHLQKRQKVLHRLVALSSLQSIEASQTTTTPRGLLALPKDVLLRICRMDTWVSGWGPLWSKLFFSSATMFILRLVTDRDMEVRRQRWSIHVARWSSHVGFHRWTERSSTHIYSEQ